MSIYCVTFRIADKTVDGKSFAGRYGKLVENALKDGGGYWKETPSFFLVESSLKTDAFAKQLYNGLSE